MPVAPFPEQVRCLEDIIDVIAQRSKDDEKADGENKVKPTDLSRQCDFTSAHLTPLPRPPPIVVVLQTVRAGDQAAAAAAVAAVDRKARGAFIERSPKLSTHDLERSDDGAADGEEVQEGAGDDRDHDHWLDHRGHDVGEHDRGCVRHGAGLANERTGK